MRKNSLRVLFLELRCMCAASGPSAVTPIFSSMPHTQYDESFVLPQRRRELQEKLTIFFTQLFPSPEMGTSSPCKHRGKQRVVSRLAKGWCPSWNKGWNFCCAAQNSDSWPSGPRIVIAHVLLCWWYMSAKSWWGNNISCICLPKGWLKTISML